MSDLTPTKKYKLPYIERRILKDPLSYRVGEYVVYHLPPISLR